MIVSASTSFDQLGSDIDGEAADDRSGSSVSLSSDGTIVAIGDEAANGNALDSGRVRVYQYSNNSWTQLGADIDGEAANNYSGRGLSLSSDGTIVAIGAPWHSSDGTNDAAGHVRVYQYDGVSGDSDGVDGWTQLGADIDGEAAGDESGSSVSLSSDGTIVAIGAFRNGGTGDSAGHVRVYQYSNDSWTQLGADIDGEAEYDMSGSSVSLSSDGTIVAIGAYGNDGTGNSAGHVRVYQYDGVSGDSDGVDGWTQLGSDIDGEAEYDSSGVSVSVSSDGTIVAIGAHENFGNGDYSGHTRVYQYDGVSGDSDGVDGWTQLGADIDGEAADNYSGRSVSLSSDGARLGIGAAWNGGTAPLAGHVRVYSITTTAAPTTTTAAPTTTTAAPTTTTAAPTTTTTTAPPVAAPPTAGPADPATGSPTFTG